MEVVAAAAAPESPPACVVSKFGAMFHMVRTIGTKKVLSDVTHTHALTRAHPCYSALVNIVSQQAPTTLLELLDAPHQYCVEVVADVHEGPQPYLGCREKPPCVHCMIVLYKCTTPNKERCDEDTIHTVVDIDALPPDTHALYEKNVLKIAYDLSTYTAARK